MHLVGDDEADGERRSVLRRIDDDDKIEFGFELGGGADTDAESLAWAGKH